LIVIYKYNILFLGIDFVLNFSTLPETPKYRALAINIYYHLNLLLIE